MSPDSGKKLAAWQGSASDSVLGARGLGQHGVRRRRVHQANGASTRHRGLRTRPFGQPAHDLSASADKVVKSLAVVPGRNQLIIGGSFDSLSGTSRNSIGSLDLTTGAVQAWKPAYPFPVIDVAADGSAVYVAGGGDGGNFVAFDPSTGVVDWRGGTNGNAQAITVTNGVVYVGGHFTTYCGARTGQETCTKATGRKKLLAVDASTGALEPWNPGANSTLGVFALAAGGGTVSAGGDFTQAGSASSRASRRSASAGSGQAARWRVISSPSLASASTRSCNSANSGSVEATTIRWPSASETTNVLRPSGVRSIDVLHTSFHAMWLWFARPAASIPRLSTCTHSARRAAGHRRRAALRSPRDVPSSRVGDLTEGAARVGVNDLHAPVIGHRGALPHHRIR